MNIYRRRIFLSVFCLLSVIALSAVFISRVKIKDVLIRALAPDLPDAQTVDELTGFSAPGAGIENAALLPPSINLAIPFASQAPHANWDLPYQEACEEASMIMAARFLRGQPLDADIMDAEILKLVDWQEKRFGYYKDTTAAEMAIVMREYFGFNRVEVRTEFTIDDIKREIAAGRPVILPAAGRLLSNPNFRQPGPVYHALTVKGYLKDGSIITNDPGTRNGKDFLYDPEILYNAIHDWVIGDITLGQKAMIVVYAGEKAQEAGPL